MAAACGYRGRLDGEAGGRRRCLVLTQAYSCPVRLTSLRCLLSDGLRGEGLGIPSPLLGCHGRYGPEGQLQWHVQSGFFLVFLHLALCCPRRTGNLDYLGDGVYSSSAPCIWKSLVRAFA